MSTILEQIDSHDSAQFLDLLDQFPDQIQNAWEIGERVDVPDLKPDGVVVCGMGGSGISGELLRQFTTDQATTPVVPNRFYELPEWVGEDSLVILVSYSGNTEETLSCFQQARDRSAPCVTLTSNGELEKKARNHNETVITIPPGMPPRCAAGYLFIPLLFLFDKIGISAAPSQENYREACEKTLEITEEFAPEVNDNRALDIARRLQNRTPIIYGSSPFTGVLARRFKNQLNENAKIFSVYNELPELHHNEIMSWDHLADDPDRYGVVFLRDAGETKRVQKRFQLTRDIMRNSVARIEEVQGRGDSRFARYLSLMLYTDYISYYLAILRNKDPVAIGPIQQLKEEL